MAIARAALRSLYWRETNGQVAYTILDTDKYGMGDIALNQVSNLSPVFGRGPDGVFRVQISVREAPSDFDSFELMFLEDDETEVRLLQMLRDFRPIYFQRLTFSCPPVNNRALWTELEHFTIEPSGGTLGAGPNRDGSDAPVESRAPVKVTESARLYKLSLSRLTTTEAENILCVDGLSEPNDCLPGYPGQDEILVFGAEAGTGVVANALYSTNGGGTIAGYTTDPSPSAVINVGVVTALARIIDGTQFRALYGLDADPISGVKTQWAYQDFPVSNVTLTAASWNVITIAATSLGDGIEAQEWYQDIGRIYTASAGDVYLSTDDAIADPGTAIATGANAIAQFGRDEDKNVWYVAAANDIQRELANNRDTFAARTGPSGGGAFTAVAFADDGLMFAGNGTSIFLSKDKAGTTGGWVSLKDFGASHLVKNIQCKNGTSQCLRVAVDDTTPGPGEVWESEDGGNSWRQVTETALTLGYNDAYFSKDPNKAVIVGDADVAGPLGYIELLST